MEYAIEKLKHDEVVLMKKVRSMKDGKPKWVASEQLNQISTAIKLLERYNSISEAEVENEDQILQEIFIANPPKAMA